VLVNAIARVPFRHPCSTVRRRNGEAPSWRSCQSAGSELSTRSLRPQCCWLPPTAPTTSGRRWVPTAGT
jgi:hypothetical protein